MTYIEYDDCRIIKLAHTPWRLNNLPAVDQEIIYF